MNGFDTSPSDQYLRSQSIFTDIVYMKRIIIIINIKLSLWILEIYCQNINLYSKIRRKRTIYLFKLDQDSELCGDE